MPKLLDKTIEKNKLKIERAALHLFTRKGFHGTTVREIAKKAGVSMGKLYIYYDTKEEIFIELVQRMGAKMEVLRQERIDSSADVPRSPFDEDVGDDHRTDYFGKPRLLAAHVHRCRRISA